MAGLIPASELAHGQTVLFLQRRWSVQHVQPVTDPPHALGVCLVPDETRSGEPGVLSMILISLPTKRFAVLAEEPQICKPPPPPPQESE